MGRAVQCTHHSYATFIQNLPRMDSCHSNSISHTWRPAEGCQIGEKFLKKPMLFLSGTRDVFARRDLLEKVVAKIGPSAQIHWIENGDHSLKTSDSRSERTSGMEEALAHLLEWLEKVSPSRKD